MGSNSADVTLSVGFKADLKNLKREVDDALKGLNGSIKDDKITQQIQNLQATFEKMFSTLESQFDKIFNETISTKVFEDFRSSIETQMRSLQETTETLQTSFANLQTSLDAIDPGKSVATVEKIVAKMNELSTVVKNTSGVLKTLMDATGFDIKIDGGSLEKATEQARRYVHTLEEMRKLNTQFKALSSGDAFDRLGSKYTIDDEEPYDRVTNALREYAEAKRDASKIKGLDASGRIDILADKYAKAANALLDFKRISKGVAADAPKNWIDEDLIGVLDDFSEKNIAKQFQGINGIFRELSESSVNAKEKAETAATAVSNMFKIENGKIEIPINLSETAEKLRPQVEAIIEQLQAYSSTNPVEVQMILTSGLGSSGKAAVQEQMSNLKVDVDTTDAKSDIAAVTSQLKSEMDNASTNLVISSNVDATAENIRDSVRTLQQELRSPAYRVQIVVDAESTGANAVDVSGVSNKVIAKAKAKVSEDTKKALVDAASKSAESDADGVPINIKPITAGFMEQIQTAIGADSVYINVEPQNTAGFVNNLQSHLNHYSVNVNLNNADSEGEINSAAKSVPVNIKANLSGFMDQIRNSIENEVVWIYVRGEGVDEIRNEIHHKLNGMNIYVDINPRIDSFAEDIEHQVKDVKVGISPEDPNGFIAKIQDSVASSPVRVEVRPMTSQFIKDLEFAISDFIDSGKIGANIFEEDSITIKSIIQDVKSLAQSLKSFNGLNINIGAGSRNSIDAQRRYGISARQSISDLQEQAAAIESVFKKMMGIDDGIGAVLNASQGTDLFERLLGSWEGSTLKGNSLSKQMSYLNDYINGMKKLASVKNIDLSSVTSGFTKTAEQIIEDTNKVATGEKEMEDSMERLKNIFNGGINVEKMDAQLDGVVAKLEELHSALTALIDSSSKAAIEGIAQNLKELLDVLTQVQTMFANTDFATNKRLDGTQLAGSIKEAAEKANVLAPIKADPAILLSSIEDAVSGKVVQIGVEGDIKSTGKASSGAKRSGSTTEENAESIEQRRVFANQMRNELGLVKPGAITTTNSSRDINAMISRYISGAETDKQAIIDAIENYHNEIAEIASALGTGSSSSGEMQRAITDVGNFRKQIASIQERISKAYGDTAELDEALAELDRLSGALNTAKEHGKLWATQYADFTDLRNSFNGRLGVRESASQFLGKIDEADKANFGDAYKNLESEVRAAVDQFETGRISVDEFNNSLAASLKIFNQVRAVGSGKLFQNLGTMGSAKTEIDNVLSGYSDVKSSGELTQSATNKDLYTQKAQVADLNGDLLELKFTWSSVANAMSVSSRVIGDAFSIASESIKEVRAEFEAANEGVNEGTQELRANISAIFDQLDSGAIKANTKEWYAAIKEVTELVKDFGTKTKTADTINSLIDDYESKIRGIDLSRQEGYPDAFSKLRSDFKAFSEELRDNSDIDAFKMKMREAFADFDKVAGGDIGKTVAAGAGTYDEAREAIERYVSSYAKVKEQIKAPLQPDANGLYTFTAQVRDAAGEVYDLSFKWDAASQRVAVAAKTLGREATGIGSAIQAVGSKFKQLATYWAAMMFSPMDMIRYARRIGTVIKDLDDALTEMRKVSDEPLRALKDYQIESFDFADKLGTTAKDIQDSTADWLRLGESFSEAKQSAQEATLLLNVSEFDNIDSATEALVSASQAYKDLDKIEIIDKLNNIGNNFSVSTDKLAEGLQNSAAVLATQGNSIDQAIALLTAGNSITQDMSKTSAGIRTISLRIAGKNMPEYAVMRKRSYKR